MNVCWVHNHECECSGSWQVEEIIASTKRQYKSNDSRAVAIRTCDPTFAKYINIVAKDTAFALRFHCHRGQDTAHCVCLALSLPSVAKTLPFLAALRSPRLSQAIGISHLERARCRPKPQINSPASVLCMSWCADLEFRVTQPPQAGLPHAELVQRLRRQEKAAAGRWRDIRAAGRRRR